ncbi:MAG: hypothetical protein JSV88_31825, partial [Candidatus Aminicenantes bacterium]
RFVAKSNISMLIRMYSGKKSVNSFTVEQMYKTGFFSFKDEVKPKPFPPLDTERSRALQKLQLKEKLIKKLPGMDCGICGAPDCKTLADDIARDKAKLADCRFLKEEDNCERKS